MEEPEPLANEGWFSRNWRPAMAWIWGVVIIFDFIIFPILNGIAAGMFKWFTYTPWSPMTLQAGGLFHASMAGVVGVAAWRRTDDKRMIYDAYSGGSTTTEITSTSTRPPRSD